MQIAWDREDDAFMAVVPVARFLAAADNNLKSFDGDMIKKKDKED